MAVNNSTATLTQEMQVFYDKLFLERVQAETCYDFLTSKRSIPKNSGKVVYLTRQTAFTPSTTALTEGTTPTAAAFTAATVSATVAGYGEYTTFSDLFSSWASGFDFITSLEFTKALPKVFNFSSNSKDLLAILSRI